MKEIIKYVADDGTSFDTKKECLDYEKSINKYTVSFLSERWVEKPLSKREFDSEAEAKRFIANTLHDCFKGEFTRIIKLSHLGTVVEFTSTELGEVVPTHLKINGEKLNEVFQMCATKNVKIEGYTLHGDYYLADEVIPNKTWEEACKMKKPVKLPNGEIVIAGTLSKEELESIPEEERKFGIKWYWTSTLRDDGSACVVYDDGDFDYGSITASSIYGGIRLGFKNPFAN